MTPIHKRLKYMEITWIPKEKKMRIFGDNKFVMGEIYISPGYFLTVVSFIQRVWRQKK